jgi:hypothetical protein
MVNFYCSFLPNWAQVLRPLTDLLKEGAKTLKWIASAQEAFQGAKCLLAAAVPLQHPAPTAELSLATDASDTHIGGHAAKIWKQLATFWILFSQTDGHKVSLLHF